MLTKEEIQKYKMALEQEKIRIFSEMKEGEKLEDFGDDVDHFDEETNEAEETANQLSVESVLKERVDAIDMAINRMIEGKYGMCTKCGKAIEKEVLDIAPESELCISCKQAKAL
ncbi:MAG: hypothetical protein Q7S28_03005 [bacterium]|nr:hypothetical protein [bacterium]